MFGPPDSQSQHSDASMRWKIKRFTNDSLRQKFVDATVPQGHYLGLTFPDPELRYDEATGHWEFGAIDWDEFRRVLAGDGPCNRERLAARRRAHEDGAWVREAALAYAAKQRAARIARPPEHDRARHPAVGGVHPRAHRPRAQACRIGARGRRNVGAAGGARRLHAARRGAFHLGRAVGRDHRIGSVPTRTCCSSRRVRRSTVTRPSTKCPTKWTTCNAAVQAALHRAWLAQQG